MAHPIPRFVTPDPVYIPSSPEGFLMAMACFTTVLFTLRVTSEILSRRIGILHWLSVLATYLIMSFVLYWFAHFLSGFGTWGTIGMLLLLPSQLAIYTSLCESCKEVPEGYQVRPESEQRPISQEESLIRDLDALLAKKADTKKAA